MALYLYEYKIVHKNYGTENIMNNNNVETAVYLEKCSNNLNKEMINNGEFNL